MLKNLNEACVVKKCKVLYINNFTVAKCIQYYPKFKIKKHKKDKYIIIIILKREKLVHNK